MIVEVPVDDPAGGSPAQRWPARVLRPLRLYAGAGGRGDAVGLGLDQQRRSQPVSGGVVRERLAIPDAE